MSGGGSQSLFASLLMNPELAVAFSADPARFALDHGYDPAETRALAGVDPHRLAVTANLALAKRLRLFKLHVLALLLAYEQDTPGRGRLTRLVVQAGLHSAKSAEECWSRLPFVVSALRDDSAFVVEADLLEFELIVHGLMKRGVVPPVQSATHPALHPDAVVAGFGSSVTKARRLARQHRPLSAVPRTVTHYLIRRQGDWEVRVRSIPNDVGEILERCDGSTAPSSMARALDRPLVDVERVIADAAGQGLVLTGRQRFPPHASGRAPRQV